MHRWLAVHQPFKYCPNKKWNCLCQWTSSSVSIAVILSQVQIAHIRFLPSQLCLIVQFQIKVVNRKEFIADKASNIDHILHAGLSVISYASVRRIDRKRSPFFAFRTYAFGIYSNKSQLLTRYQSSKRCLFLLCTLFVFDSWIAVKFNSWLLPLTMYQFKCENFCLRE